jgi:starch-binding outer membrane protein, SusD/RagB family
VVATEDFQNKPLLRLAETYLVLAEAQFNQGKLADAAESLNVVRRRANASEITPAQVTVDFILDERARELLAEEHRRHHLVRTGTYLERTRRNNPIITGQFLQDHNILLPIPQAVIDANLDRPMPQNPGY